MAKLSRHVGRWWQALMQPAASADLVLASPAAEFRTVPVLLGIIVTLYALYGFSMGLFRGFSPALVSAFKLPLLYLFTIIVCFPAFYIANCLTGPRLNAGSCLRLLLLAASANALAVCSYAPVSYFFTLTTSDGGYSFLVLMHVAVLALAGLASVMVGAIIFRAAAREFGRGFTRPALAVWALLYGITGTQMAWVLRPWVASPHIDYAPLRGIQGSFVETVANMLFP